MKLVRFGAVGAEKPGLIDAVGQLRDLSEIVSNISGNTLLPDELSRLSSLIVDRLPVVNGTPRLGPCVGGVGKIIGVGLNYSDHAAESNMEVPEEPILFMKPSSAIVGPYDNVEIPLESKKTDWEVELGVVIGLPGKYIPEAQSLKHVAGYCVINDVSEREFQLERGNQWDKGKSHDTFAPIGPWLVTSDEVPDPQALDLWLDVDDRRYQSGNTRTMVFGVAHLVSYISKFMSLQPGDIISTGTPPGVGLGQAPPTYLKAGQTMRLGIEGLGIQEQLTVPAMLDDSHDDSSISAAQ
ncbi:MAG: fumarylacetoacetate hydrolase family protein [Gammaproteobacteria bacterium]|nr:fumarylacetoacetate hydrolase family protein [Gammaproteobacteria bacterium]